MEKKTPQELGRILYDETCNITMIYFDAKKSETLDRQLWAWLHMGFIAGLKISGYTDEECDQILDIAHKHLEDHDDRYREGTK